MFVRVLVLLLISLSGLAQVAPPAHRVKGTVTDEKGKPLNFASIYAKGTTKGTTTNSEGFFSLELTPGKYELIFRYLGYQTLTRPVEVADTSITLKVQLQPESLLLRTLTVTSRKRNTKDPAYGIIRQVIRKRKYYLNQVSRYSADVYLKGLQRLAKSPRKMLGQDILIPGLDSAGRGIVYLSEAVARYYYEAPEQEKEVIVSSKVSGQSQTFTFNSALGLALNFYENLIRIEPLSKRGFVSPISGNALFFYDYKLEGTYAEGDYRIHKIRVTPRRREDPVFRGYLYIQDKYWRVHSTNLYLTREAKIDFVDTFAVAQTYLPVRDSVWMMGTQKMDFDFELLGFAGSGYYMGIYANYTLDSLRRVPFARGEIGRIEPDANQKDAQYWESVRAVPLTQEELQDYRRKERLDQKWQSKAYKDSLDAISNAFKPGKLLLGYTYSNRYRGEALSFGSLLENLQYNTVEGFVINLPINYRRNYEMKRRLFSVENTLRYGFSSRTFYAKTLLTYSFNRRRGQSIGLEGGKFVSQFNENGPITPFVNTIYSLLMRENYLKLFEKVYARLNYNHELFNGVYLYPYAEFAQRNPLTNRASYAFTDRDNGNWTANTPQPDPQQSFREGSAFTPYRALTVGLNLAIRLGQRYYSRPDFKSIESSGLPRFNLEYRRGVPGVFNSITDYNFLSIRGRYDLSLGLLGTSSFDVTAGTFLDRRNVPFVDFRHFYGNRTIFSSDRLSAFFLLPYYQYSTTDRFAEGHYEHHFNGFIFNKVPLFRKLKFHEVGGMHVLVTTAVTYAEITLGVENIFKVGRVDFVTSFNRDGNLGTGFRFRLGI